METIIYDHPYLGLNWGGEEQREYGFVTSKLIRPMRAKIGRARRNMADKLYQSGKEEVRRAYQEVKNKSQSKVRNKNLRNSILRTEVPKVKSTVLFNSDKIAETGGGSTVFKSSLNDPKVVRNMKSVGGKKDKKLIDKVIKDGRNLESGIFLEKNPGVETLAHELGHAKGRVSGGLRGKISRLDPRINRQGRGTLDVYDARFIPAQGNDRIGFKDAVKDYFNNIKNSRLIVAEENAASREGLRMMKRNGASKEELSRAKENLRIAGDTYRSAGKRATRTSLGRIIDIPSRRNTPSLLE